MSYIFDAIPKILNQYVVDNFLRWMSRSKECHRREMARSELHFVLDFVMGIWNSDHGTIIEKFPIATFNNRGGIWPSG